ncbi:MAG: hypothetical protein MUE50_20465, partial [Pirellulaceae bacterium]|nr:hypothetical protein [Pirellulaceae bacterium]
MNDNSGNSRRPTEPKIPSNGQNLIWYLIPIAAAAFIASMFFVNAASHEISYYDFLRLIEVSRLDEQGKPVSKTPYVIVKTAAGEGRVKLTRYSKLRDLRNGLQTVSGLVDVENLGESSAQAPDTAPPPAAIRDGERKGVVFRAVKPASSEAEQQLLRKLEEYHLPYSNEPGPSAWRSYMPLLIISALFIGLFLVMMRRLSGAGSPMSFGRSR